MPNHSTIVITGHLGREPEVRKLQNGNTVTGFSVAVNTGYGERENTTWYNVSIFGKQGERAQKYLNKGSAVTIAGEFSAREYEGKNGKAMSLDITAYSWSFAGSGPKGDGITNDTGALQAMADKSDAATYDDGPDIPF